MVRYLLSVLLVSGLVFLSSCSDSTPVAADRPAVKTGNYEFRSVDTTIQSRGVPVPVTFVVPLGADDDKFPLVVMAHGHGGSREEGGGFRLVAETLGSHGVASIRMDFAGCGDSTEPFTENNLSTMLVDLQAARKFAATMSEVDDDRIGLLGYSMGGRLVALLAEIDSSYKVMTTWAPAVANAAERELTELGGPDAYYDLKKKAYETGSAEYTTRWGTQLQLGYRWFTDIEKSTPLDSLAKFTGPLLVLYGDQDEVVPASISEAAIVAATSSSEVVRVAIPGAQHGLGFYTDRPEIATQVVDTTVGFFAERL